MTKFIFITGGVVSSLGKGIASASLGAVLQARGYKVRLRKLDPYLNVDPGTMSPFQHGEVYVTDDGAETDLDLGHYERFTGVPARQSDNITTGQIYSDVLTRERRGDYLGKTVQVIPHVTDAIKDFITSEIDDRDFILCEIGGTVGDIESLPFLEAIRQLRNELGRENTLFIHLTLLPYIPAAGEIKTKPTQHSVKELLSVGIQPDVLVCRSDRPVPEESRAKIALFCNVRRESVILAEDVDTIYRVPLSYHKAGFDTEVLRFFKMEAPAPDLSAWETIVDRQINTKNKVTIGMVGKYMENKDSYKSLTESLVHGGMANNTQVQINWIDSNTVTDQELAELDGILVPGGFGKRGADGKIKAITFARENNIPYLGICFGMQLAVVEAARNLAGIKNANTTEFGACDDPVVGLLTEWKKGNQLEQRSEDGDMGGTMRLGAYPAKLKKGSLIHSIYGADEISERHRHRYEVNMAYKEKLEKAGLLFTGMSPDGTLPEIVEVKDHPWFVGVQFHPELKSKPFDPHPLFSSFIEAAAKKKETLKKVA